MQTKVILIIFWLLLGIGVPVDTVSAQDTMTSSVTDGDTLILSDGRTVRLVGIQAPKLPLGRPGFPEWPLAIESKAFLEELVADQSLRLSFGGRQRDRYRRYLAHLVRESDGLWIQGAILEAGMARVYSFPDNRGRVADMLVVEREAQRHRRGIWALPTYAIRDPFGLEGELGSFQIVEGVVVHAAKVKSTVYLNFNSDWRTDFTARIKGKVMRMFHKANRDPLKFQGETIRVRGWLKSYNGPMIDITHPEQIEGPDWPLPYVN